LLVVQLGPGDRRCGSWNKIRIVQTDEVINKQRSSKRRNGLKSLNVVQLTVNRRAQISGFYVAMQSGHRQYSME
jgi:hypothetical protein